MRQVKAKAIKVADRWIIEVRAYRFLIPVDALADVDARVAAAIARVEGKVVHEIEVEIVVYLHLDDCSPYRQYQLHTYRRAPDDDVA